jgi:hypothetical protein
MGSDVWQRVLSHRFMLDGYTDRATNQRLTGDWIIFGKHDGANYYLDLATHEDGTQPERLLERADDGRTKAADACSALRPLARQNHLVNTATKPILIRSPRRRGRTKAAGQ